MKSPSRTLESTSHAISPGTLAAVSRVDRVGSTLRSSGETWRGDDGQRTVRSVDEDSVQATLPARCAGRADGRDRCARITAARVPRKSRLRAACAADWPVSRVRRDSSASTIQATVAILPPAARTAPESACRLTTTRARRFSASRARPAAHNAAASAFPMTIPCSEDLCVSEPCNQVMCGPGEYCCNESCSQCVGLGQVCTDEYCPPGQPSGEPCGPNICGAGEYCCNESCGICAPLGGGCIELFCEPPGQVGVACGPTTCAPGQVCCNESCGICTPPDGVCIMIACVD